MIAIASGKGGTGKTTVAVNLALSVGNVQRFAHTMRLLFSGVREQMIAEACWSFPIFTTAAALAPRSAQKVQSARSIVESASSKLEDPVR